MEKVKVKVNIKAEELTSSLGEPRA
ncbi:Protein of unknown function [Bacillus wiedmannii]|nr:Protein of unknown function [Bacillus wiedmannii]SCL95850.1 Protein of unknown function [Bacillus wiedmannii]SCL95855.1 Protein of unknown function [Bacillus wiedmannii]SCL95873.1 Protein of unknown function [Bacillus wiedmannii]